MYARGDSKAYSIVFVYRGSGCDTANGPTPRNEEMALKLSVPRDGLNTVLGQIMYVFSCLLSLDILSDVS